MWLGNLVCDWSCMPQGSRTWPHLQSLISESDTGCVLEVSALMLNSRAVGTKGAFFSEFIRIVSQLHWILCFSMCLEREVPLLTFGELSRVQCFKGSCVGPLSNFLRYELQQGRHVKTQELYEKCYSEKITVFSITWYLK